MSLSFVSYVGADPRPSRPPPTVSARYDAATTTTLNRDHWSAADSHDANAALSPWVRKKLRERSRLEADNNPMLQGMLSTLQTDLVGDGPRLQLEIPGIEADDPRIERIENDTWDWHQRIGMTEKVRLARRARAVDGEAFGLLFNNATFPRDGVLLDIRLIETDQIADPLPFNEIGRVDGLRTDAQGNKVAWHVLRHHPGALAFIPANTGRWVPADQVLYWANLTRPGQHRGVGELVAALELFGLHRRWTMATVTACEMAASLAGVLETTLPPTADGQAEPPIAPLDTLPIVRGQLLQLPAGWKLGQMNAAHPTTTHAEFSRVLINAIARCLNMPYIVAALDASQASYSSMRGDYLVYHAWIDSLRADVSRVWLDPAQRAYWDEYTVLPSSDHLDGLPPVSTWRWTWGWGERKSIDPETEANAAKILLEAGLTCRRDESTRGGRDWMKIFRNLSTEERMIAEMRAGHPAMPGQNHSASEEGRVPHTNRA